MNPALRAQDILWQSCYGGSALDNAYAYDIANDGSYVLVGTTRSYDLEGVTKENSDADMLVVKMNSKGRVLWKKVIGGTFNEEARAVKTTRDGGFLIAGWTDSREYTGGDRKKDVFVVRLDAVGNLLWNKAYGGPGNESARALVLLPDGGCIIGGETASNSGDVSGLKGGSDAWALRLDAQGGLVWQKTFGGAGNENFTALTLTPEQHIVAVGPTDSVNEDLMAIPNRGKTDVFVVCFNTNGRVQWKNAYGGNSFDEPYAVTVTLDSLLVVAGTTFSTQGDIVASHGKADVFLLTLTPTGVRLRADAYGGSGDDGANSVAFCYDGQLLVAATSGSRDQHLKANRGGIDSWVFKVNARREITWGKSFGGSKDEQCSAALEIPGGDYVALGFTASEDGDLQNIHKYGANDFWAVALQDPNSSSRNVISLTPTTVIGYITDKRTRKFLRAEVQLIDNARNEKITSVYSDTLFGIYQLFLPDTDLTSIGAFAEGYLFYTQNIRISPGQRYSEIRLDIELEPIAKGKSLNLYNIHFDIGKATLRPDSRPELDRIITFLRQNPTTVVRLNGHTDDTGDKSTKVTLSQMRADEVKRYIIEKGKIAHTRLLTKGWGMDKPLVPNDSEENRQKNRRVEFEIISK
jgi:outer membrane protein OmpA-like peptidoglycan-associated protein